MVQTKRDIKEKVDIERMKAKDAEIVKGIFHHHEQPGGTLKFSLKYYRGQPLEDWEFCDGKLYEIPLGVARHLNKSGRYPIHEYKLDAEGHPSQEIGQRVARYSFESTEFMDVSDMRSEDDNIPEIKAS